jgi:hypothetical protein
MKSGGAAPKPRKPRRRRLSRRRFWRRIAWAVFFLVLVVVGTRPAYHSIRTLTRTHHSHVTHRWDVVQLADDRRSVVIRVDECGVDYAGTRVTRVGSNVRLIVSTRPDRDDGATTCGRFDEMPVHLVRFGFALPASGHVLASGCPRDECGDEGAT